MKIVFDQYFGLRRLDCRASLKSLKSPFVCGWIDSA